MWTPRRIALLLTGLVLFVGGYLGYARLLGSFDGLPPLPDAFQPNPHAPIVPPTESTISSLEQKFELAFGVNCPELSGTYPIKLDLGGRGILVAAQEFNIQKDGDPRPGWVRLSPLSLGMVGKKKTDKGIPEINTLYCDFAFLKFDKPIKSLSDMDGSKIVMAELHADPDTKTFDARRGRIRGLNNRKTVDPNDDIEMVAPGPLYYEAEPATGRPHIYSFTAVQVFDHLNTNLPTPDRNEPREPTVYGVGLRVYLTPEEKKPAGKGAVVKKAPRKDEPKQSLSGVDVVELDNSVEMNLWTEEGASFVAPTGEKKKDPKTALVGKDGEKKKDGPPPEKRLLTVKTDGPFRYDLRIELAHFEKPPVPKPGITEHVIVTRANAGGKPGQDLLRCEYLDVQFQRLPPEQPAKGPNPREVAAPKTEIGKADPPPARKGPAGKNGNAPGPEGNLSVKSMRAWGEDVVIQSDLENLHASGTEMTHDADKKLTILKGDGVKRVEAVKDGNLLEGPEIHLFSTDGNELSQAQVLGAGSIGFGDTDPEGNYFKTAVWTESMLYTKQAEKGRPPLDVLTFVGAPGKKAVFEDRSSGEPQQIEAHQLKVWLKAQDKADPKAPKKAGPKGDVTRSARPTRLEATGQVRSTAPELRIHHTDYLNVWFQDVPKLTKPPAEDKNPNFVGPPAALAGAADPKAKPGDPKAPTPKDGVAAAPKGPAAKKDPKAESKKPLVVVAKTIETWVNRDPQNQMEVDRVHAEGDVDARQAAAKAGDPDTRVVGETVDMKTHAEGNELVVTGNQADPTGPKWGMVQNDQLTVYGYKINIDQRQNEAHVVGEGSMQMISASDLEGKKLEKPVPMTIYWKHKMDFQGTDRLINYHGDVKGFQEGHRVRCEWMQVLLDRPVYLNQAMKPKDAKAEAPLPKVPAGFVGPPAPPKKDEDRPKVDTVICVHLPKDDDAPRPKVPQPVFVVEEEKFQNKLIKYQSIQAPEVVTVNTPKDGKVLHELTATATDTMPGLVRIWQPGQKDETKDDKGPAKKDGPKPPARGKGELGPDEEMKLTVVQFGEKMKGEDFRKRAKFWGNIYVLHMPADRPQIPVDLRGGDIPKGAFWMECRDTLDVYTAPQTEIRDGKPIEVSYQEMIGKGHVRFRKQGEFFGDADIVKYSELKGTLTFEGTEKNPVVINEQQGQGVKTKQYIGQVIKYYTKKKIFDVEKGTTLGQ
jgi:hypothetical protein